MPRRPSTSTLLKRAQILAQDKFGFQDLSSGQRDALSALFNSHDTLAILATGGGKSAIYQIAGLIQGGLTVVISPLVALQHDQVEHLIALEVEAHLLNSSLGSSEREMVWASVEKAKTSFLLLAPEQLSSHDTLERLHALKPALFVVDEAHCISSWGHDFRPDFARLGLIIESLGRPRILALTATAAPPIRSDILERLHMKEAEVVVAGFDRPNLRLEVRHFVRCDEKIKALVETVESGPKPAIVYCATRSETELITEQLGREGQNALAYHAGLSKHERDARQRAFMDNEADIFVATIAFGMGVDKPNVRRVYHYDVSESLDSYFQEAGRAGRDSASAEAILFFCSNDLGLRRFQNSTGKSASQTPLRLMAALKDMKANNLEQIEKELDLGRSALWRALLQLEAVGALRLDANGHVQLQENIDLKFLKREIKSQNKKSHAWDSSRLEMMNQYAQTNNCRRQLLLAYFGQELPQPCGNCDNCDNCEGLRLSSGRQSVSPEPSAWSIGGHVCHKIWGEGEIMREDEDSLTVVFPSVGYKTLSRQLAIENHLLEILV